jgi:hypothetical protein
MIPDYFLTIGERKSVHGRAPRGERHDCKAFPDGRCRTRTCDHLRVKQALYQLS